MARLLETYREEVRPRLMEEFSIENPHAVPRIEKVVVSMGIGRAVETRKRLEDGLRDLALITGQKPVMTRAKKSISNFKLRQGQPIGCKATLRRLRMYEFLDRLINVAMPRIRDFRGVSGRSFDGRGNYAMGIKEHIVSPEINFDKVDEVWGMDIIIATTAKTDAEAKALLKHFNMPFNS